MSLKIYISHTGVRLLADPISFASPDALRSWLANNISVPADRQILMTSRGKNVKQQHLLTETEVFVYDKQYLSEATERPLSTQDANLAPLNFRTAPTTVADEQSLQLWQELFLKRRSWSLEAAAGIAKIIEPARKIQDETDVISRSTAVALDNLKNHAGSIQQKFESARKWARQTIEDQQAALEEWPSSLDVLRGIPVRSDLAEILRGTPAVDGGSQQDDSGLTLHEMVNLAEVEDAAKELSTYSGTFKVKVEELEAAMARLIVDASTVQQYGDVHQPLEDIDGLLDEFTTPTKKISSDYEDSLAFQNNTKGISTASRRALIQARDFLPTLQTILTEVDEMIPVLISRRHEALITLLTALREISVVESGLADLQSSVANLDIEPREHENFDVVNKIFQLPIAYGSTLIEAVRRTEWNKRMEDELSPMREELQLHVSDEEKRRQKWAKSMSEYLHSIASDPSLAVSRNLLTSEHPWPTGSRNEIFTYIDDLRACGVDDAVQQMTSLLKELDAPTKSRKRQIKAFKNGSVYDLGRSTVADGEVDDITVLQDDKLRLEDKLRASDSRVRKLEDLLHRQSQMSRPLSGTFEPVIERHSPSPVANSSSRPGELVSRRSSVSSRRLSNHNGDEKGLVQRIVSLEAEVIRLQREAQHERRSSNECRDKMQEAEAIKRDLMANFESQKQEFDDERQMLEDETHKLKIRVDEVEDELDRVLGSRDHQRLTSEQAVADMRAELDYLRRTSADEAAKLSNQVQLARKDLQAERDGVLALEEQLKQRSKERTELQTQRSEIANRFRKLESEQHEITSSLQIAHGNLSPGGSPPEELQRLVKAIEVLSEGLDIHARGLEDAFQLSTAENKSLEGRLAQAEAGVKASNDRLALEEAQSTSLRESLAQESIRVSSLRAELSREQEELKALQSRFAAGETGSETLKERLNEEENRVSELTEKLATASARSHSVEMEFDNMRGETAAANNRAEELRHHLETRGSKAKELSERLFHHHDRIVRMLEQLGYCITRQDDQLVIQRASRVSASTTFSSTTVDASISMKRTISGPPTQHYSDPSDLDTLYWMSDADMAMEEDKFRGFVSTLARLDLDNSIDLIIKRYKDVEALAKKYQKDSRAYRDKSHRLQSEAHDKIAYRSFKDGDLALFLPTRNQATRPWAAFNVGAPHYFLREQDSHRLQSREWLVARIHKVEERVVDLSRSLTAGVGGHPDRQSASTEASDAGSTKSIEDENPFELSDGLRWYMIDASEEKPGAPSTPGLGRSTVAATNVEARGSIRLTQEGKKGKDSSGSGNAVMVAKTLTKSLDSRRSSSGSKKGHGHSPSMTQPSSLLSRTAEAREAPAATVVRPADADLEPGRAAREDAPVFDVVRKDLLLGP